MRVLWLTNTPSGYQVLSGGYNGGGWIYSLEKEIIKRTDIQLGICFLLDNQPQMVEANGVTYFPIDTREKKRFSTFFFRNNRGQDELILKKIIEDIELFKPDIINVFGTEMCFGLLAKSVRVPLVIHIQGLMMPYQNAFLLPGQSLHNYFYSGEGLKSVVRKKLSYKRFLSYGAERELRIFKYCKHYLGRTDWDKNIVSLFSPESSYDYSSEILRPIFYEAEGRLYQPSKLTITTTISGVPYKGFDVVLKCAKLLKEVLALDFDWYVFGDINPKEEEKRLRINCSKNNIHIMGVANADDLAQCISHSTCYVHPSYIDNSPNSICEAQMLGCPVVAQYVGGIPSLIEQGINGVLVPANDPYQMAVFINRLHRDKEYNASLSSRAKKTAYERHDKKKICDNLVNIYNKIIKGYISD